MEKKWTNETPENFSKWIENSLKFSKNIFQSNFSAWPEAPWQNFGRHRSTNKLIVGDELYEKTKEGPTEFTEGGICI